MILILCTMTVFVARGFGPRDTAYEPFGLEPRPCSSCATRSVLRSFLSSEPFPFSESQGALVSCTVHLAFLLRNAPALRPGCTWTLVPTIPPVFRGLSACAGDRRGVLTSAPAILLQDEWAYETPTGTMLCRRHRGSLDATEPSLRRFRRTTDIRLGILVFLGKFYISSYST